MTTTKQYDRLNRLKRISSTAQGSAAPSLPLTSDYLYNNANQRIRSVAADGSYWVYTYDSLGQVTSGNRYWQDGTPVAGQQFVYAHDDIGNRKETYTGGDASGGSLRQASYTANRLNQYDSRTVPSAVDILGIANPTAAVTVNGNTANRKGEYFWYGLSTPNSSQAWYGSVTVNSTYPPGQSESGNIFAPKTPELFEYDLDGNLTNDGRWSYTWDGENRLVKMEPSGTVTPPTGSRRKVEFAYDHQSRRIWQKITNLDTTEVKEQVFVYDGWNLIATLNPQLSAINTFIWGLDLSGSFQGAGGVGGLLKVTYKGAQTTNCFAAFDGNGNVLGLIDAANGGLVARYEYGPFGEVLRATGPMAKANPIRFSTQYTDDETDLVCYLHRYYNPSTGRWLSRDPIEEEGGLNIYAFVDNNPVDWFDILGERSNFAVDFSIPSTIPGLNGYVRGDFWKDDCCINGSLFIAAELAPPGFHHVGRLANRFNIHFELGARGGGRVEVGYCAGQGCLSAKVCARLEAFARAEYRGLGGRPRPGGFTRIRFGAAAEGAAELCLDLCSGAVTFGSDVSFYGYLNFGTRHFNRSYTFGWNWSLPVSQVGTWPQGAVLRRTGWCCNN